MNRPTAIPTTHTVRLAPKWVRTWKTEPSPPRSATHVAIGRSRPMGRWPKAMIPRTTTAATQAAAPTTTALGTRALIAGCLPFTEKEKPPPCERTTRHIGWADASRPSPRDRRGRDRRDRRPAADVDRRGHRTLPHQGAPERAARTMGRAGERLVPGASHGRPRSVGTSRFDDRDDRERLGGGGRGGDRPVDRADGGATPRS